jgi:hypothetical protein
VLEGVGASAYTGAAEFLSNKVHTSLHLDPSVVV